MGDITLEQEIMDVVRKLNIEQQRTVLEQVRRLVRPKGTSGKLAIQYAREIGFTSEDLAEMEQAIDEAVESFEL